MKKILLVFGTRPEAIKMCPLIKEFNTRCEISCVVCVTGQHREMLDQVLRVFNVEPDIDLRIMRQGQDLFYITTAVLGQMKEVLNDMKPDIVLVHGDTTSSFAAALAAYYMKIPVGHVEAGLRTYNIFEPLPEEFNRQAVDALSTFFFVPTENCRQNLLMEGKDPEKIFVTGNTVIDALKNTISVDYYHSELEWARGSKLILMTVHRRENLGDRMRAIFAAIRRIVDTYPDVKVIYPVHLNPKVYALAESILGEMDRVHLIEPLDVLDFHNFMNASYMILTDSGGIQEEAPSLNKPVLVVREKTERPEGVEAGTLRVVGTKEENIFNECKKLLENNDVYEKMCRAKNPYGDGHTSERIADIVIESLKNRRGDEK